MLKVSEKNGGLPIKVFVCDGRSRASLQICRSLSNLGHEVHIGEAFLCSSFFSNSIKKKVMYPDPDTSEVAFLSFIENYCKLNDISFIFPVRDSSTSLMSQHKDTILNFCKILVPNFDDFNMFQDKSLLIKKSLQLGIPVPKTIFGKDLGNEINYNTLSEELGKKIIAKPSLSSGSRGIFLLSSNQDFSTFLEHNSANLRNYIFQQFIPHGGAVGVYNLVDKGKPIATNTHFRIREYPHSGGPSTLRRSGKHSLCEYFSNKILESSSWSGVSMVEFRIHKETKVPYLMEINPRFWGSLALDIHSGVDFPGLVLEHVFPDLVKKSCNNRIGGVITRWLFLGDILWLLTHDNKVKALKTFLNFKGQKFDILDWNDPLPVIGSFLEGLLSFTIKSRRQHAFGRGW